MSTGVREQKGPLGSCSLPLSAGRALGSPTRGGQQGSEGRLAGSSRSLCVLELSLSLRFCCRNLSSPRSVALVGVADFMLSWGYHEDHRCQAEAEPGQGLGSQGAVMFLSTNQLPQTSHLHLTPNVSLRCDMNIGVSDGMRKQDNMSVSQTP